jgi:broad specificity phosphatase PhoE
MAMPNNLLLVRHGESEGNPILKALRENRHHPDAEILSKVDTSGWRLTRHGVRQAHDTGAWLRDNGLARFDLYLCSDYARARETAAELGLADAKWRIEFYLRERDRGRESALLPKEELERRFQGSREEKARHAFYWRPECGESMADLCKRVNRVLDTLWRENDGDNVIVVCHEEVMWAFRMRLEKLAPEDYLKLDEDEALKVHNCQIWHYTRLDPQTKRQDIHFTHRATYDPCEPRRSRSWEPIHRPRHSNEELLKGLPPSTLKA